MNHDSVIAVNHNPNFQWVSIECGADVHGDRRIFGLERPPVISIRVDHVVVGDTVLAGARLDVH